MNSTVQSDTPRTDAAAEETFVVSGSTCEHQQLLEDFARTLERENARHAPRVRPRHAGSAIMNRNPDDRQDEQDDPLQAPVGSGGYRRLPAPDPDQS